MPAKRPKKKKRRGVSPRDAAQERLAAELRGAEESRGAEALTVLWMLTALATLIAETVAAAAAILALRPRTNGGDSLLDLFPGVMLFTAIVTGTICLALSPLIVHLRRTPPPRGVVAIAILLGVSPWLLLAVSLARG